MIKRHLSQLVLCCLLWMLAGCAADFTNPSPVASVGSGLSGRVHGGQQPVSGAQVYLYAAGSGGIGTASRSMLNGAGYVTTAADGSFSISGDYTCQPGDMVYLLSRGGNPGLAAGTNNTWAVMEAALGPCSGLTSSTYVFINEVTTVATAYALNGFQSAPGMLASGSSAQAKVGLANAFAMVNLLVNTTTGTATPENLSAQTVVPGTKINTLANVLANCINSDGTGSGCSGLEFAVFSSVNRSFISDTLQGVINLANQPGYNPTAIFNLSAANAPFQPALSSAPNDWTLVVAFGNGKVHAYSLAIDGLGNAWMTMPTNAVQTAITSTVAELSPTGTLLSPTGGYTAGGLVLATEGLAIDDSNNVWVADEGQPLGNSYQSPVNGKLVKMDNNGNVLSPVGGYTSTGSNGFVQLAIDGSGSVWTEGSNGMTKFDTNGNRQLLLPELYVGASYTFAIDQSNNLWAATSGPVSSNEVVLEYNSSGVPTGSFTPPDNDQFLGAIDSAGAVWMIGNSKVGKLSATGAQVSPVGGYTGGGIRNPNGIAIDGAGMVWVSNYYYAIDKTNYARITELTPTGSAYSGSTGYMSNYFNVPLSIAIDASGNVWVGDQYNAVTVILGAATPVVTPLATAVKLGKIGATP